LKATIIGGGGGVKCQFVDEARNDGRRARTVWTII
jgi:hypothetical protein